MINHKASITEKAVGKIKIFVSAKNKINANNLMQKLRGRQTYREILQCAKKDGLMNASVYQTHGSFSLDTEVSLSNTETENTQTVLCIELIDEKIKLEDFCKKHYLLLQGKVIVYKAVEFWTIKQDQ